MVLPKQRPPAPRHLWRSGPLAFSGLPRNGCGPSAAAVECVPRRDVRQPAVPDGRAATMPLIQGGPPEWIGERTPEALMWEVVTPDRPDGQTLYELRVQCGLEIMRLQFFTAEEVRLLAAHGP